MGLVVDKTLSDGLLDDSVAQGICKVCGNTIIVQTNKSQDICPHCGSTYKIDDVVSDNSIQINLDDLG